MVDDWHFHVFLHGVSVPAPRPVAASVFVDGVRHTGILSYLVPQDMTVNIGDAVEIPYGSRFMKGMVVELLDNAGRANKNILRVYGVRVSSKQVMLATNIAKHHFVEPAKVLVRLSPRTGKGAEPVDPGPLKLHSRARSLLPNKSMTRQLIVPGPLVDISLLTAQEAARLSHFGQVLVLCPTVEQVVAVHAQFSGGAVRLDAKAERGSWSAFRDGAAQVGVATRAGALYYAPNLGGVIVVDDTHVGHEEVSQPHTHARDLASARARIEGARLTIVSPVPSPQALAATSAAYPVGGWPRVLIADRAEQGHLTAAVCPTMAKSLSNAKKARRGVTVLASTNTTVRRCWTCGDIRNCLLCEGTACACQGNDPCVKCSDTRVRVSGWDTSRLSKVFSADVSVHTIHKAKLSVNSQTVIAFDVDSMFYVADLYPDVNVARFLYQCARLAGERGELVVGTTHPGNQTLRELVAGRGLLPTMRRTAGCASELGLPPSTRMVTVTFSRKTRPPVNDWPGKVSTPRSTGDGWWEVIVRIPQDELLTLEPFISKARKNSKARVKVS